MPMPASTSTTTSLEDTSSHAYDTIFGTSTSSSSTASGTGSGEYPVFPNAAYISRFYVVSSQDSGLTDLDIDLYNACFLPHNPLSHHNYRRDDASEAISPKPTYLIDEAPCKRQAAINSNCYFQNTNGSFTGLQPYSGDWDVQQQCYCDIYPFFDSAAGCQECYRQHGGIEGYHWFPQSYVMGVSSAYCSASPQTTGFYPFANGYSMISASSLPSTTAVNSLGTQTAASLYYTYAAATGGSSSGEKSSAATTCLSLRRALLAALPLVLILSR